MIGLAIEETYYKRTVDFYTNNKDAFVYTVDFDAGEKHERRMATTHSRYDSNFLITATHALFIGNLKHSTPGMMAVVGIQFRYDTLQEFFLNTTNKFNVPCTHLDVDCYLIDNNAFVILSNHKTSDVGKFFGQIDGDILDELINSGVYQRVHLYDYQAICLDEEIVSGPSTNPFIYSIVNLFAKTMRSFIKWLGLIYINILYGINDGTWLSSLIMAEKTYNVRQDNWIEMGSPFGSGK
ncbi:hypothetical protein BLA29_003098 [Euroglyphus maynei]|uniref:Voltage-dependent calcium channel alpha-2/delta subunit conserved region domain-containing protein n=1 Tax=Euroglyphus maynei TaxID=6958 RepID=A0A1Y3BE45_EURMA|nr:hypothetical protein BLA29_003098 [Euroglyphus maynei]